jgi:hypothetical protein
MPAKEMARGARDTCKAFGKRRQHAGMLQQRRRADEPGFPPELQNIRREFRQLRAFALL